MSTYLAGKLLHPDFMVPNRKPVGNTIVDRSEPLSRGLISFAVMNERSGSTIRDSVNPGLAYTKTTPVNWQQFNGVWTQRSRVVSGDSDYITSNKVLLPATGNFSFFIKVDRNNIDSAASNQYLGQYTGGQTGRFLFIVSATEQLSISLDGTTTTIGSAGATPTTGWFTIGLTRNGSTWTGYVNGVSVGTATDATAIYQGVNTSILGSTLAGNYRGYSSHWCLYNRAITDSEMLALHKDNFKPLMPIVPVWYFTPSGAAAIVLGVPSETDTLLGLTLFKSLSIGLSSETCTALALLPAKSVTSGIASETDSIFSMSVGKTTSIALAGETDTVPSTVINKDYPIGIVSETDTVFLLTPIKQVPIGIAEETDTALDLVDFGGAISTGIATETDSCFPLTLVKALSLVSITAETSSALALGITKSLSLNISTETDTALGISGITKSLSIGLASEDDSALSVAVSRIFSIGIVAENDSVFSIASISKALTSGIAEETDSALRLDGQAALNNLRLQPLIYVGDELYTLRRV